MTQSNFQRRYPIGAELIADGLTHFRVWAPKANRLEVALQSASESKPERSFHPLQAESSGYFSGAVTAKAGTFYRLRINDSETLYPDPASRFQPLGPHGYSCVIDPKQFRWTDQQWKGLQIKGQIIYEMHIGTFTPEGTWRAAAQQLAELARVGVTVVEVMPVADFPGQFGWGYDGVNLFAPSHLYGHPDELRDFVNQAHSLGVGVILDVVYNHFGPEGNYLGAFSSDYFTDRYENEWGAAVNFDGPNSGPVREFFITNGRYWIDEFHFDGFRFDATQSIFDSSDEYILAAIGRAARAAAHNRSLLLVAENEPQEVKLVRPLSEGGYELDALWNDDLHHSSIVALTGRHEAYYSDYRGKPQEFISAAKHGYLFQGQPYTWQEAPRGTPTNGISAEAFVGYLENHDQVANSAFGERVRFQTSPGRYRAMITLLLLGPWTPLIFQGQEFGASSPFLYFADLGADLREPTRRGRRKFLAQFPSLATDEIQAQLPDPSDPENFNRSKLDFSEREKNRGTCDLFFDLLKLRREDPRFREQKLGGVDGAVLGGTSFVLRYFGDDKDDRLLVVNLGESSPLLPAPEPLLAPPLGCRWDTLFTSDLPRYGGPGAIQVTSDEHWLLPAEGAVVLRPVPEITPRKKAKKK